MDKISELEKEVREIRHLLDKEDYLTIGVRHSSYGVVSDVVRDAIKYTLRNYLEEDSDEGFNQGLLLEKLYESVMLGLDETLIFPDGKFE